MAFILIDMAFTSPHYLIFLLALLPLLAVAVGGGSCPAGDASSLLAFKHALFDPEGHLVSWSAAVDCCLWVHVSCDATGATILHLAGLSLSSSDKDALTPLAGLNNLVSLDLSNNNFVDLPIPAGIFPHLPRLTHLNLSMSGFSGRAPLDLGTARMLVSLNLSAVIVRDWRMRRVGNGLWVEDASFLADLPELELLYLDGVDLSMAFPPGKSCRALSSWLPKLRAVSLKDCSLVNCPLETMLNNLTSITHLCLDSNNFSSSPIPAFLSDFPSLSVLRLASCGLVGEFPVAVFQMKRLRILDVSNNLGLSWKLFEFPKGSFLEELVISGTNFNGELPSSIANLAHLTNLEASNAQLSGEFPEEIKKMVGLTYLDLSRNNFTGRIPSLVELKRLVRLDLSSNRFQGCVPDVAEIPPRLEVLILMNNLLSGSIPTSLFALPSLRSLFLDENNFTGVLHEFDVIGNNSVLSMLGLSNNRIQGEFPRSIFQLSQLTHLWLSSNNFSGVLQLDMLIGSIPYLYYLDLSRSGLSVQVQENSSLSNSMKLSGLMLASCNLTRVPAFLQNHHSLFELDLSNNRISGDIPDWLWKLQSHQYLNLTNNRFLSLQPSLRWISVIDLHANQLQEPIPLTSISGIFLDLSGNRFNSTLPRDIGMYLSGNRFNSTLPRDIGKYLLNTSFVSLSRNNLIGIIPASICQVDLKFLDLSGNNLNGSIPSCLPGKMIDLEVLNLRENSINGVIPDAFSKGCSLKTLDLYGNKIEGRMPASLKNCKQLEVLNLGNNGIEGGFPSWLGEMPHLHILVLRSNRLRGRVEPYLGGFQQLQIMDLSSNSFSGNLCSSCFNSWKSMIASENKPYDDQATEFGKNINMAVTFYYRDALILTIKGSELKLERILTAFVYIDLSVNNFEGFIPETIGNLSLLYHLNLSHNALTNTIPRSIGNLLQLEFLDLSRNNLTGEIPQEIVRLTFLSGLNLSSNRLVGEIPRSQQLDTFSASSYGDNAGLCGLPLYNSCEHQIIHHPSEYTTSSKSHNFNKRTWIVAEVGFIFGFGVIWLPLVFFRRWWIFYFSYVDSLLWRIPFLHLLLQY